MRSKNFHKENCSNAIIWRQIDIAVAVTVVTYFMLGLIGLIWLENCSVIRLYFKIASAANGDRGGTVVKVLCYKSEGRWFDTRWCHWNFH